MRRRILKKIAVIVSAGCLMVSAYGCLWLVAGTAGGAGTAVWLSGKLTQGVNAPFDRSVNAAKFALQSLDLPIIKETKKEDVVQFIAKYTDGRQLWIDIRPVGELSSKIEVRVGVVPDRAAAGRIMDKITRSL